MVISLCLLQSDGGVVWSYHCVCCSLTVVWCGHIIVSVAVWRWCGGQCLLQSDGGVVVTVSVVV